MYGGVDKGIEVELAWARQNGEGSEGVGRRKGAVGARGGGQCWWVVREFLLGVKI
jgi:hypothetical protein